MKHVRKFLQDPKKLKVLTKYVTTVSSDNLRFARPSNKIGFFGRELSSPVQQNAYCPRNQ